MGEPNIEEQLEIMSDSFSSAMRQVMKLEKQQDELFSKIKELSRKLHQSSECGIAGDTEITRVIYNQKEIDKINKLISKIEGYK